MCFGNNWIFSYCYITRLLNDKAFLNNATVPSVNIEVAVSKKSPNPLSKH